MAELSIFTIGHYTKNVELFSIAMRSIYVVLQEFPVFRAYSTYVSEIVISHRDHL